MPEHYGKKSKMGKKKGAASKMMKAKTKDKKKKPMRRGYA